VGLILYPFHHLTLYEEAVFWLFTVFFPLADPAAITSSTTFFRPSWLFATPLKNMFRAVATFSSGRFSPIAVSAGYHVLFELLSGIRNRLRKKFTFYCLPRGAFS